MQNNLFKMIAEGLWAQGEDGEQIARDLAEAFVWVVQEGKGEDAKPLDELLRFMRESADLV
jgi:hypothetical protein